MVFIINGLFCYKPLYLKGYKGFLIGKLTVVLAASIHVSICLQHMTLWRLTLMQLICDYSVMASRMMTQRIECFKLSVYDSDQ